MQAINAILQQLATTSATTAKLNILKTNAEIETLKKSFFYAYNPTFNYFIKKIPQYTATGTKPFNIAFDCLDKLIKREVTGNAAIDELADTLSQLSPEDAIILENIIKGDMRCGISTATVNKVWKNLIPDFPYMRCSLPNKAKLKTWPFSRGVYQQLKADGQFINLNYVNGDVSILSRQGSAYPLEHFQDLVAEVKQSFVLDTQTHGEIIVFRNGTMLPREISNGLMNSVLKGGKFEPGDVPRYLVWDQIPISAVQTNGKYPAPYSLRYYTLVNQCSSNLKCIEVIETKIVYSIDEVIETFSDHLGRGLEGSIIKHPDAIWEDTTSTSQVKLKLNADVDLRIVGFNAGNGKNAKTFGSIKCVSEDELLEVNISGFTDAKRLEIFKMSSELIDTIITVKGNCIMMPSASNTKASIFLPRFVELRSDKTTADDMVRIQDSFANAINEIRSQFE
jgi:DNA ligase-1